MYEMIHGAVYCEEICDINKCVLNNCRLAVVVPNPVLQDLGLLKNALSACFSADTFLDVKLISPFGRTKVQGKF